MKYFPDTLRQWVVAAGFGLCLSLYPGNSSAQQLTATVLKNMGNLVVLDIGAVSGIQSELEYRLYQAPSDGPPPDPSDREGYLGIWTVTQVFGDYSIGRFFLSGADVTARSGDLLALFPFHPVDNGTTMQAAPQESAATPSIRRMLKAPEGINLTPGTNLPWPVSVGFCGLLGYANFSDQIVSTIQDFQQQLFNGGEVSQSSQFRVGFGMDLQVLSKPKRGMRLSYRHIQNVSDLSARRTVPPADENLEYTGDWDMETKTTVNTIALSFLWGNFRPVYDQYRQSATIVKPRRFGWYYGGGVDCAWVRYKTRERAELLQGENSRFVNNNQDFTLGQYWGMHLVGGLSYNFPAVRSFLELNGIVWSDRDFKIALPLRAGFEIFF